MNLDYILIARALLWKVARWESISGGITGEFCFGEMRYGTKLDACGLPILTDQMRAQLKQEMEKV